MNSLVSVVVPIYKVEPYLERCVSSVIAQTYQNLEIILVDDGSPDKCGEICEKLARDDDRIVVYHKENGGLSDARNYGVERSNGEYITFLDSDDYIAPDYVEYLVYLLQKNNADISCCCMVKTEKDTTEYCTNNTISQEQLLTGKDACKALFGSLYMILVTACGKLYKNEIVKKHPFPVGKKHEDEATTCKYYYESDKVVVGNRCLYAYYQNMSSITHTKGSKLNEDAVWALSHRAEFFEKLNERLLAQAGWGMLFRYYVNDSKNNNGRCDCFLKEFAQGKSLSLRTQFELNLYNASPCLYERFLQFKTAIKSKIMSFR